jgi:D-hydroxyproline dehydrogenase subunit beta
MPRPADVIVIGGGVVGAACARELAAAGARVTLLEAGRAASGATGSGMGHVVAMSDSPAQLALTAWSRTLVQELEAPLTAAAGYLPCGTLWIAEDEAQLAAAGAMHEAFGAAGVAAELLDAAGVAAAEPALRPGLAGGLRVPGDVVLSPPRLAAWLLAEAVAHGCDVRERTPVERIEEDGTVVTAVGRLRADAVVNAAGAWAPRLTPGLPIVPRKGHLIETAPMPGVCTHQLVELGYLASAHGFDGASVAFNLQPRRAGGLLIGSSRELVGWEPHIDEAILERMLARAAAFVPALAGAVRTNAWVGFRPAVADKLPLIGRWPAVLGLWIAAGHEGLGVTTALGTARLLAALIAGREPPIDAKPFSPERVAAAGASKPDLGGS